MGYFGFIIIRATIDGTYQVNLDKIVGVFINTLPIRSYPGSKKTVGELINELKVHYL